MVKQSLLHFSQMALTSTFETQESTETILLEESARNSQNTSPPIFTINTEEIFNHEQNSFIS